MAISTMVGREVNTAFLIHQFFFLRDSCTFVVFLNSRTVHATGCEDRTHRRTHRTRGAHSYFSHTNVTRDQRTYVGSNMRGIAPCLSKVIFSSSMFHGTLLDPHMSPHFSTPFSTQFSTPFPAPTPLLKTSMSQ